MSDFAVLLVVLLLAVLAATAVVVWVVLRQKAALTTASHDMVQNVGTTLAANAARQESRASEEGDRLRRALGEELARTRDQLARLETTQSERLSAQQQALAQEISKLILATQDRLNALEAIQTRNLAAQREVTSEQLSKLQLATSDKLASLEAAQTQNLHAHQQVVSEQLSQLILDFETGQQTLKGELLAQTLERLNETARSQQTAVLATLQDIRSQFAEAASHLQKGVEARMGEISGKVNERLDEGFKKTNDTFVSVMQRLATIDEAQKKIDGLTTNVVSLQQLLGDKRARGAFGEMQLETIVRNQLPDGAFEFQYTLKRGVRVDCMLKLPEPTGLVAVDSKFPLENYERMIAGGTSGAFKADLRRHIDDVASKYIVAGETSDGAVLFIPAEAVFAEIHASHRDLVEYAQARRVWLVSPTTLMAVLNTARAVLKDVETRRQVHIIKSELGKLGQEFGRFQQRMDKFAKHIEQVNEDAQQLKTTGGKISKRFAEIEKAELDVMPLGVPPSPAAALPASPLMQPELFDGEGDRPAS